MEAGRTDMAVRIFKSRWFRKFARDENISDEKLCQAVRDAEAGRVDADYGGGVIKQRIARPNQGKSGGCRYVVLYRRGDKAFFVYGFPKSQRANIGPVEEREFKELAKVTLALSDAQLATLLKTGAYKEVACDD
jgi:hypothetical protein